MEGSREAGSQQKVRAWQAAPGPVHKVNRQDPVASPAGGSGSRHWPADPFRSGMRKPPGFTPYTASWEEPDTRSQRSQKLGLKNLARQRTPMSINYVPLPVPHSALWLRGPGPESLPSDQRPPILLEAGSKGSTLNCSFTSQGHENWSLCWEKRLLQERKGF